MSMSAPFNVGDELPRSSIHDSLGGLRHGTISLVPERNLILLFFKPDSNLSPGFESVQGFEEQGTFLFPGEGRSESQVMEGGNLALANSDKESSQIYLFESRAQNAKYLGEFVNMPDDLSWVRNKDFHGQERDALVFRLRSVDQSPSSESLSPPEQQLEEHPWTPPSWEDYLLKHNGEDGAETSATRAEFELESRFGRWRILLGSQIVDLRIQVGGTHIEPDLFDKTRGEVIEAKRSGSRQMVRMAIGQVLDYKNELSKYLDDPVSAAILLPGAPADNLPALCAELGIRIYIPDGEEFIEFTSQAQGSRRKQ